MKVVQEQTLHYLLEVETKNESDDNALSVSRDLLVRMCDLVSDITAIDKAIVVSKYVLKYNCRLLYTKYDLYLMRSVEDMYSPRS